MPNQTLVIHFISSISVQEYCIFLFKLHMCISWILLPVVIYVEQTAVPEEPIVEVKAEPEPVYIDEVSTGWSSATCLHLSGEV